MKNSHADILIIGAGAAGAAIAWSLSLSKFNIVCFEQGGIVSKDIYSQNNTEWEKLRRVQYNPNPNLRKNISDYPVNDNNSPISIANYNGVGGSTILYSGHLLRFHPSDFKIKSLDNVGSNWPLSYKDLEKYYSLNEKMMGVAGVSGDPAYPKIKNLLPHVKLGISGDIIASAFNDLGWHWWPSYSGIATRKIKNRKIGSKSSVDVSYWPKAISNGVKLKTDTRVLKILTDQKGNVNGVVYKDKQNTERFQSASLIIIACNGIGTPRLLLNSANKLFPNGLANNSGLVGKNLMLHPLGFVEGKFDKFLASYLGPEGCCLFSHEFYETNKKLKHKRGYTMHILRGSGPIETAIFSKKFKRISYGKNFHKDFLNNYGHTIPMAIICEDLPEKNNHITLDHSIKDSSGMPGVKINYKLSENSKKMLSHGISKGKELMRKAGAREILAFGPVKHAGWHLMGTAKMGISKKNSVVNKYGQSHDIRNLIVADSSIFPSSGGVNPMSTLQALALNIANAIKKTPQKFFR